MPPRNAAAVPTAHGSSACPSVSPATVSVASISSGSRSTVRNGPASWRGSNSVPDASMLVAGVNGDLLDGKHAGKAERARHRQRTRRPGPVQHRLRFDARRVRFNHDADGRALEIERAPHQAERLRGRHLVDQLAARGQPLDDAQPPVDARLVRDRRPHHVGARFDSSGEPDIGFASSFALISAWRRSTDARRRVLLELAIKRLPVETQPLCGARLVATLGGRAPS